MVGLGQVLLVRDEDALPDRRPRGSGRGLRRCSRYCCAGAGAGDAQGDQVHLEPAGEVLADQLAEALAEAVDAGRVKRHQLLRRVGLPLPEVHAHGAGVDPPPDPRLLGQVEEQVQGLGVDVVVVHDRLHVLGGVRAPLPPAHHQPDEGVHPLQGPAQGLGVGDGPLDELQPLVGGRAQIEHAEGVARAQVGGDERPHVAGAPDEQHLHGRSFGLGTWDFGLRTRTRTYTA